jgi:hypothetical protein
MVSNLERERDRTGAERNPVAELNAPLETEIRNAAY